MSDQIPEILSRLARVEAAVAGIGHNGGPPLEESEPPRGPHEDCLFPTSAVAARYGVSTRTIARWVTQPGLGFPKPEVINLRNYWRGLRLSAWDRARRAARKVKTIQPTPPRRGGGGCAENTVTTDE